MMAVEVPWQVDNLRKLRGRY